MPAAKKMAAGIAMQAPIAVRNCKKAINDGLQVDMDEAIVIHDKKIVVPIDLKTSYKPEWDFYKSFIDWRYENIVSRQSNLQ